MAVENKIQKMAELYRSGLSLEAVGDEFGMTRQGVRYLFMRAGMERRSAAKYKNIDVKRLEKLYADNLSLDKIAALLSVCKSVIIEALKFYKIPKRRPIGKGTYRAEFLKSLKIGERKQIKIRSKTYAGLYETAKRLGIKISVRSRDDGESLEITRLQ